MIEESFWHKVAPQDQTRIKCVDCRTKDAPAVACQTDFWRVGNQKGASFWYYCALHAKRRGFTPEIANG